MTPSLLHWANGYLAAKVGLGKTLGLSKAMLHMNAGLVIFVLAALLLRQRMRSPWPLAVVAIAALLNETVDYFAVPSDFSFRDMANTIFWPLVLFLLSRRGGGISEKL